MTRPTQPDDLVVDDQAGFHYEFSNEFYALWLDRTMTYSCAYFPTGTETLEQAQQAKVDLALRKLQVAPGQRLLDVGCGWGAAAARAAELHRVRAIGLTLSQNQFELAQGRQRATLDLAYRLAPWETFHEPVDRIMSFGAFEHFTSAKYPAFFARCRELLPGDGRLLVQTITIGRPSRSFALRRFAYFLIKELFIGVAELPRPEVVVAEARVAGLELLHAESMREHYIRTLDVWLANLEATRREAAELTNEQVVDKFLRYLEGSRTFFASGETNVYQFLFGVA
jgi:cyclopropane-fatty-acyl-phospholipid synthase